MAGAGGTPLGVACGSESGDGCGARFDADGRDLHGTPSGRRHGRLIAVAAPRAIHRAHVPTSIHERAGKREQAGSRRSREQAGLRERRRSASVQRRRDHTVRAAPAGAGGPALAACGGGTGGPAPAAVSGGRAPAANASPGAAAAAAPARAARTGKPGPCTATSRTPASRPPRSSISTCRPGLRAVSGDRRHPRRRLHGGRQEQRPGGADAPGARARLRGGVHRLPPQRRGGAPAQIEDVESGHPLAARQRGRYKVDPARIAVWGDSARGNLAALGRHVGRRRRAVGPGPRQRRPVRRRAGGRRLVRSHLDARGRLRLPRQPRRPDRP